MQNYEKNLELLNKNHVYSNDMEHDSCGVGLIASTEGKKSRAEFQNWQVLLIQIGTGWRL